MKEVEREDFKYWSKIRKNRKGGFHNSQGSSLIAPASTRNYLGFIAAFEFNFVIKMREEGIMLLLNRSPVAKMGGNRPSTRSF